MLEFLEKMQISSDTIFTLIQATSPLTSSEDFIQAHKKYQDNKIDSLLTCTLSHCFFWSKDGKSINYNYNNRPRRQDFDGTYVENGAFYISTAKNIKEHKNRLSGNIGIYEMPSYTQYELDEEHDFVIIESLMQKYYSS